MNEIVNLKIESLKHHPENPRKDLGDLTELAESIKQNGIMQNLTVVFDDLQGSGKYLVVIGNRRMEAAKIAGLDMLPCVISDMDHKTQIATMLEENMQRTDLTLYEQAQGFQMMMDLGYTPKEIGEKTGFSETTVNRRLKMAQLDKKTFQQAVGKQITMDDLDRLGQIEDLEKRNELLAKFGENNFEWLTHAAIANQKADKVRPKALEMLKAAKVQKLTKEQESQLYRMDVWERLYDARLELDKWDGKKNFIPKQETQLYYKMDGRDIWFYIKNKKKKAEPVKKTPEEIEEEKRKELCWKTAERATEAAYVLRREYAKKLKVTPSNAMEMLQWALIAGGCMVFDYNDPASELKKMCGLENEYHIPTRLEGFFKIIHSLPQSRWPEIIFLFFEGDTHGGYVEGIKRDFPIWTDNKRVNFCYLWLRQFGYRMSDEEEQLQLGTHECFQVRMGGV